MRGLAVYNTAKATLLLTSSTTADCPLNVSECSAKGVELITSHFIFRAAHQGATQEDGHRKRNREQKEDPQHRLQPLSVSCPVPDIVPGGPRHRVGGWSFRVPNVLQEGRVLSLFPVEVKAPPGEPGVELESAPITRRQFQQGSTTPGATESHQNAGGGMPR